MRCLQKGQSLVEFAFTLPLFFVLFFFIFYAGMIMADYLSLSSMARSSAREAAIITANEKYKFDNNYRYVRDKYKDMKLPADIFEWKPQNTECFLIEYKDSNVVVTMNATLKDSSLGLAKLAGFVNHKDLKLSVTYTMYSEYKP